MRTILIIGILFAIGCGGGNSKKDDARTESSFEYAPQTDGRARNLAPTLSKTENVLIENATVMTATGQTIEGGNVWIRDGKIEAVGAEKITADGATVIDGTGLFVTPGIIDTHSHLGVYSTPGIRAHSDGNEATNKSTPHVDALNSVFPQDPGFQRALSLGGVTVAQILPGSANLIGGNGATIEMRPAISARAMLMEGAPKTIKMACGENPKRVYGERGGPSTRMGTYAAFRDLFQKGNAHKDKIADHQKAIRKWEDDGSDNSKKPKAPSRDHGMDTLAGVMTGDTLVQIHCYRADEMIQLIQLSEEFGFKIRSFHHAVEAYKIRDVLAKYDISVSTWADWWGFKIEAHDAILQNAGLLSEAGVTTIIHSDSGVGIQRLNQEAAKAYFQAKRDGLDVSENDALRWITYNAAWALGIEKVTGTLETGKRADVVVWSEHPFSIYAKPKFVFVAGSKEFDATQPFVPWSDFETGQVLELQTGGKP